MALDDHRDPTSYLKPRPRLEPEVAAKQTGDTARTVALQGQESGERDGQPTRYRQHDLEIRRLNGFAEFPAYAQLIDYFVDVPENPSILLILFLHVLVIVRGRNLKTHLAGLRQRTLWIIEQHATPPDNPGALYVESIEFVRENIFPTLTMLLDEKKPKEREAA